MKLRQRVQTAYKILTDNNLGNSLGTVLRNYAKQPEFRPHDQLKGITYKAIDKIGTSLSIYEPQVIKKNGDAYENHPLLNLYKQPNPRQSASDFIHLFGMLYEIYGETFWYLVRGENTRKVKEVWLLNPAAMELKISEGELIGYTLHKTSGQQVPFLPEEIIHDKRPNPFNEWRGMSVMERAAVYIDTEITTSVFTLNYMKNNASPSGIVSLPDMDKEAFKQFAAQWREGYEGPENAGKTAFIRGGEADFKAVGATLKDIDQKVTRDMAKDDVLMMLEVPKPLLGLTDDKGFGRGNVETLHYIFAKEKLEPLMRRLDRIYMTILQDSPQTEQAVNVTHESPIPEDKEFLLKTHEKAVNVWMTVNEAREAQGLPPVKGGDEIISTNAVPRPVATTSESVKVKLKKEVSKADRIRKERQDQEEHRLKLVANSETYATKLKRAISAFARKQEFNVIERFNASTKAYEEWLFNVKEESEALAVILTPIIIDLMEEQGKDTANFITGEVLTISPDKRKTVETSVKQLAGVYNKDTLDALEATLNEGVKGGESLAKLKKRVEGVYTEAKGYRAERIARTESLRNANATAQEVYKQNGYKTEVWFANPGACEFCQVLDGKTVAISENFLNIGDVLTGANEGQMRIEYTDVGYPPVHPNCTCSIVPGEE